MLLKRVCNLTWIRSPLLHPALRDVAGMGADLFESFVGSMIACATLATDECALGGLSVVKVALPFWLAGIGVVCSACGFFCVRIGEGYPIDTGDSWSSPLFVKRILDNKAIPYSFVGALKRRS